MAAENTPVGLRREGAVAIVTIDNPPVNAASHAVRQGLEAAIAAANADPQVRAIVLAGSGRTFVAGADIREFGKPAEPPYLTEVTDAIEASGKPVVAALTGAALGGGLEIALAAHRRIAAPGATMGLPEVKLGIIPGAGGTQRLPRLVGVPAAIGLITAGRTIGAAEALALGLIDAVAETDALASAVAAALEDAAAPPRRTGARTVPAFDRAAAEAEIARAERKARGQIAPGEAGRMVLAADDLPLREGLAREFETVTRLKDSDQAKALRHVFFAEREAARVPGLEGVSPRPVARVGVVGCGLMGSGIALALLDAGLDVTVVEQSAEAVEAGRGRIVGALDRLVKAGRIDAAGRDGRLARLAMAAERTALADADLVIEAVFDDLAVKRELFAALSGILRPDAILATNTSYLDPEAIAAVVADPARVLGLHFFSPANVMRLVEVVRLRATAPDVLGAGLALAKRLGKLPVVTGVTEGFIGNRVFSAYRDEAERLVAEGAAPEAVDAAMEAHGLAMGPFAVFDMAGLEIAWGRRKRRRDAGEAVPETLADRLCEAGRLGRKTGRGWYAYDGETKRPDPEVAGLVAAFAAEHGIARQPATADAIVTRLVAAMAREGEALIAEGVAARASDVDLVMINGYGYPAFRGGPMFERGRE